MALLKDVQVDMNVFEGLISCQQTTHGRVHFSRQWQLLPIRGTASLVFGITELTMFIKTVSERRMVTPAQWCRSTQPDK